MSKPVFVVRFPGYWTSNQVHISRKALHDNDYINYNHENNKYIEWLILDILSEYKLLKKAVQ